MSYLASLSLINVLASLSLMKSWAASSREGAWSTGGYGDTGCWRMEIRFQCTWTTGALAKGYFQTYPWPWKGGGGLCQAQNSLCSEWSTEIIIAARTDFLQKETPKQNVLNISESGILLWHLFNLEIDTWRFTKGEQSKSKLAIDGCFESISFSRSLSHTCTHRRICVRTSFSSFFSPLSIPQAQPQERTSPTLSLHWLVWAPHDWSRQSPSLPTVQNSKGMPDKIVWLRLFRSLVRICLCLHNQGSVYLLSVSAMFRPERVSTRCLFCFKPLVNVTIINQKGSPLEAPFSSNIYLWYNYNESESCVSAIWCGFGSSIFTYW